MKICGSWYAIPMCSCEYLMNIVMMDLQPIFAGFFTKDAWWEDTILGSCSRSFCMTNNIIIVLCRFANPGDLIDKVEGTLLDYDADFQLLKQA